MTIFYSDGRLAKQNNSFYEVGKKLVTVNFRFDIVPAEMAIGDICIMAEGLSVSDRIHRVLNPDDQTSVSGASNNDFGFYYRKHDGLPLQQSIILNDDLVEVDKDIILDGANFGGISPALHGQGDLLRHNTNLDRTKNIGELLGRSVDSDYSGGLIFAWTMNVKPTLASKVDWDIVIEKATTL